MEYIRYTLDVIGGEPYVKCEQTLDSTPELKTLWWRIYRRMIKRSSFVGAPSSYDDLIGTRVMRSVTGEFFNDQAAYYVDSGPATHVEFRRLLRPKGRPNTQWRNGQWVTVDHEYGWGRPGEVISREGF